MQAINEKLAEIPSDRGPQLRYDPPGYSNFTQRHYREQQIDALNAEKKDIKGGFDKRLDKELVDSDPQTMRNVKDTADIHLGDNSFKSLTKEEFKEELKKSKDIDKSQDAARKLASDSRATPIKEGKDESQTGAVKGEKPMTMASRFTMNYTMELNRVKDKNIETPNQSKEKSKDIDLDRG